MTTLGELVKDRKLYSIEATRTVLDAARFMMEHNIGALPVLRSGQLAGILSERDIMNRVVAVGRTPGTTAVSEVMTANPASGVLGELSRALQAKLLLNLLAVILDGLDAQMQCLRDFLGLPPLADELKDFQFPVAECLDGRLLDIRLPTDLLLEHPRGEHVAHVNVSAQHPANGRHDVVQRAPLHQVAEGARAKSDLRVHRFLVRADDQHRQAIELRFDVAHQLQTAAVFQRNVGDDQVRLERSEGPERLGCVFLFAANHEVALLINELCNTETDDRVIVHQQDPFPLILCLNMFGLGHGYFGQSLSSAATSGINKAPAAANCLFARFPLG